MSTARFLVGDVFDRMAELDDGSFDLITCSPPFLALRAYLPEGHPDKAKEIGSEATPAEFLDTMLALAAEWRRLLAPHGSIAIEIGDTYAGSGGAGGDYGPDGLRDGQPKFRQVGSREHRPERAGTSADGGDRFVPANGGSGWPLDKSLCGIPHLFTWSLAYGRNLLTGQPSPAGQWRVRNVKPWIRTNPPVGALGDKERPATSYITVATLSRDRYFDLDAVRTAPLRDSGKVEKSGTKGSLEADRSKLMGRKGMTERIDASPAGAPPLDWLHTVDLILDTELDRRAGKPNGSGGAGGGGISAVDGGTRMGQRFADGTASTVGARGHHLRRKLEEAGILTTLDAYDVSPKGYAGAHYAVWPPELVQRLINEMAPRRVCTTCGEPSRRIVETARLEPADYSQRRKHANGERPHVGRQDRAPEVGWQIDRTTVGWSDCGHNTWRPGSILDPFAGTGTTLAVATGMARHATGIDIDERNAHLARDRVGMFLEIHERPAVEEAS